MRLPRPPRRYWLPLVIVFLVIELTLLVLPPLLRPTLEHKLSALLQRDVHIGELSLNPLTLHLHIGHLDIAHGREHELSFDALDINIGLFRSLWHRGLVLKRIQLTHPVIYIARTGAGRFNFSDILDHLSQGKPAKAPENSEPARFSLNNVGISDGSITFDDQVEHSSQHITALELGLPFLSSLPYYEEDAALPHLAGRLNGAAFATSAQTKPFSPDKESEIELRLQNVDLTHYLPYVPGPLHFKLVSAHLDSTLALNFAQSPGKTPSISLHGKIGLRGVDVRDLADQPLLALDSAQLSLRRIDPLAGRIELGQLQVDGPRLRLEKDRNGQLNLLQAFASPAAAQATTARTKPETKAKHSTLALSLEQLRLSHGQISWQDDSAGVSSNWQQLSLAVDHFSLNGAARFQLAARSSLGESLGANGSLVPTPLNVDAQLTLADLALPNYAGYLHEQIKFSIDHGQLSAQTRLHLGGDGLRLSQLGVGLQDLRLNPPHSKQAFLQLASLNVGGGELNLATHRLQVDSVASHGLNLSLNRKAQGQLDVQDWLVKAPSKPDQAHKTSDHAPAPAWDLHLNSLDIGDYAVALNDAVPAQPAHFKVDQLHLQAHDLGLERTIAIDAGARFNGSGQVHIQGQIRPQPMQADLRLNAQTLSLLALQPYFADKLNITLTRGSGSASGQVHFVERTPPYFSFHGQAGIDNFNSVDKINAADFLTWSHLAVTGIAVDSKAANIANIALSDFYSRLIVSPQARLNLMDIVVKPAAPAGTSITAPATPASAATATVATASSAAASPAAPPAAPFPLAIAKVSLSGGRIAFSDHFIRPNYDADLDKIEGTVTGLSTDGNSRAALNLTGTANQSAPLAISGTLNPLAKDLFLDIKGSVTGFELIPASPYADKYAGYGIEKGKLSMDISYSVNQGQLQANNHLFLDQLTFGNASNSPEATSLPVRLAVSLLKNRRGEIDLNLPISGSLKDPQFQIGHVIVQVLVNLLEKAATAPFALLGEAFGSSEELSYVEFAPGSSTLDPSANKRLQTLAQALDDRPGLSMEISGRVDPQADSDALRRAGLQTLLQHEQGDNAQPIAAGSPEYAKLLTQAYHHAKFDKPKTALGLERELPVADMESQLLAHINVGADDLRQLANQRAFVCQNFLHVTGKIDLARLFLTAPHLDSSDDVKGQRERTDFTLK